VKFPRFLLAAGPGLLLSFAAAAADQSLWDKSTLNAIVKRGELRVGLETGYVPFEMRDKRGNLIEKRH